MPVDPLLEPEPLAAALDGDRPPVVLDVRWTLNAPSRRDDHLAGHIPGAVRAELDTDLAQHPRSDGHGGRHRLPEPADLQVTLRRWGIDDNSAVVAYDDGDLVAAARAWWVLRWAGLGDVRVLSGGWRAWCAAGLPVRTGPVTVPRTGSAVVRPGTLPTLDAARAAGLARAGQLLDARAPARFRGETEPIDPVAGHIPGATNLPSADLLGADGRLLDPVAVRAAVDGLGVDASTQVGAYCGSGVTAALDVLALHRAGIDAALYPGSWSDWVSDPSRPVATG